ncbi:hypothetical protein DOTSEDRAFT_29962 [Dothistroma septosporum NZE10]|uniref:Uncharacterized protein n=1 Tax=Dothistroma septosporum (strain NZE10 / CBS 128990) TaxID=675120 RepID=N1Q230_DOTSN|nr:hypothetical protein DOTSEDRAFT_29962 [Dothistroma septosporum NZE10]
MARSHLLNLMHAKYLNTATTSSCGVRERTVTPRYSRNGYWDKHPKFPSDEEIHSWIEKDNTTLGLDKMREDRLGTMTGLEEFWDKVRTMAIQKDYKSPWLFYLSESENLEPAPTPTPKASATNGGDTSVGGHDDLELDPGTVNNPSSSMWNDPSYVPPKPNYVRNAAIRTDARKANAAASAITAE